MLRGDVLVSHVAYFQGNALSHVGLAMLQKMEACFEACSCRTRELVVDHGYGKTASMRGPLLVQKTLCGWRPGTAKRKRMPSFVVNALESDCAFLG